MKKPTKKQVDLARKAIGRALFGGSEAYADPEYDKNTFCQTQEALVRECAHAIALTAAESREP